MKKSLLLFILLLLLSGYKSYAQKSEHISEVITEELNTHKRYGALYGDLDFIYGSPKKIIQIKKMQLYYNKIKIKIDTTNFDKNEHIETGNLGIDTVNDIFYTYKYFDRYVFNRKKIQITADTTGGATIVHMFDKDGNEFGFKLILKNNEQFNVTETKFYLANFNFQKRDFLFNKSKKEVGLRETFKYNSTDNRLPSEIDDYVPINKLVERVFFAYINFDTHRNWTKRTETRKNAKGITTGIVTITRKITYY